MQDLPNNHEVTDHLALALVPGLGPKLTAALLTRFGSAANALRASTAELRDIPHIGDALASALATAFRTVNTAPELELLQKHGVRPVPLGFAGYPPPLARVSAPRHYFIFGANGKPRTQTPLGLWVPGVAQVME